MIDIDDSNSSTFTRIQVDITGLCHFLPIKNPDNWATKWADMILNDRTCRKDVSMLIKKAGYDIQTTSQVLYLV